MEVLIRRSGTLIDVGPTDGSPLPEPVFYALKPHLQYQYRKHIRGQAAYSQSTGRREYVASELRNMFRIEQNRLVTGYGFIPRVVSVLRQHGHDVVIHDISPPPERPNRFEEDWDAVRRYTEFRPRQEECLRAIAAAVSCNGGGVVAASTGFGKTRGLVCLALLYPRAKIHIVCKPKDVVQKIANELVGAMPNTGQVGGGRRDEGKRVTVFTADSLHHSDGDCDILLAEEAHQLMAPRYSQALGRLYRYSLNFAFTATPEGRFDGADAMMEMFFGPRIFDLPYDEAAALGLVVPIHVRWLPVRMDYNPVAGYDTATAKKRWGFWRNEPRNAIFAEAARAYPPDHQVLMMVETVEHAVHLWQHLPEFALCYGAADADAIERYKRIGMLPEGYEPMTARTREAMRHAFETMQLHKVIATDVWSTGVSFDALQTLFRLDGRDGDILSTQIPGRTSRIYEGKQYGEIYDSTDEFDKAFHARALKRRRRYKKLGWSQDWPQAGQLEVVP